MMIWFSAFCFVLIMSAGNTHIYFLLLFVCIVGLRELLRWRRRRAISQRSRIVVDVPVEVPASESVEVELGVTVNARGASSEELSDGSTLCGGTPPPSYAEVISASATERSF